MKYLIQDSLSENYAVKLSTGWIFTPLIVAAHRFKTLEEAQKYIPEILSDLHIGKEYEASIIVVGTPTYLEG